MVLWFILCNWNNHIFDSEDQLDKLYNIIQCDNIR